MRTVCIPSPSQGSKRSANTKGLHPCRETITNRESMSVQEIKTAITQLAPEDVAELAAWLEEYQAQAWDEQIARDVRAGRFEPLIQSAREQFKRGHCRTL